MPWREADRVSERREFVALAETGAVSMAELCRRFGISRQTGYERLQRWRAGGDDALQDRSRRPQRSPFRTSAVMEQLVVDLRDVHPRWGGRKINRVLEREGLVGVPAPSTITGILRRHGRLNPVPEPRAYVRFERARPNELWHMDFKGWFRLGDSTPCHPFAVLDDHSRFNLCLAACATQRTGTVTSLLGGAFEHYGLPEEILCDNGSPWGNTLNQPWTPLGVWLLDLGVRVVHARPYHPQTNGKQERFHLTLDWEVLSTKPMWHDLAAVQHAFDQWRPVYNHERPHDALSLEVPADRYQPSPRRHLDPVAAVTPDAYPDDYQIRKVSEDGRISFTGRSFRVPKAFRGRYVGVRPTTNSGSYQVLYRHQCIATIATIDLTSP